MSKSPYSLFVHTVGDGNFAVAIKLPPINGPGEALPFKILGKTHTTVGEALIDRKRLTRVANSLLLQGRMPALAFSVLELGLLRRLLSEHIASSSDNTGTHAANILKKLEMPEVPSPA